MNDGRNSGILKTIIIVIVIIGVIVLSYLLFFKKDTKESENNTQTENREVNKIEFIKKVSGESGDVYLDNKGMVYYHLSDNMRNSSNHGLVNLEQKFNTVINSVYDKDTISAILLNIANVSSVEYVNSEQEYNGMTLQLNYFKFNTTTAKEYRFIDTGIINDTIISDTIDINELIAVTSENIIGGNAEADSDNTNTNNNNSNSNNNNSNSNNNNNNTNNNNSKSNNNNNNNNNNPGTSTGKTPATGSNVPSQEELARIALEQCIRNGGCDISGNIKRSTPSDGSVTIKENKSDNGNNTNVNVPGTLQNDKPTDEEKSFISPDGQKTTPSSKTEQKTSIDTKNTESETTSTSGKVTEDQLKKAKEKVEKEIPSEEVQNIVDNVPQELKDKAKEEAATKQNKTN